MSIHNAGLVVLWLHGVHKHTTEAASARNISWDTELADDMFCGLPKLLG
jgi:hypothetical protein